MSAGVPGGRSGLLAALLASLLLGGCGSSAPSLAALRRPATRICTVAGAQLDAIPAPPGPNHGKRFLARGIAALAAELRELRELGGSGAFATAIRATAAEEAALRFTLTGLRAGEDPVVAIKTLAERLGPLEARADAEWQALRIPACMSR